MAEVGFAGVNPLGTDPPPTHGQLGVSEIIINLAGSDLPNHVKATFIDQRSSDQRRDFTGVDVTAKIWCMPLRIYRECLATS